MNTILIIEDDESIKKAYARFFSAQDEYPCEIIFLSTLDEAEFFLSDELPQRTDIVAITFDGSMIPRKNTLDTLHLVKLAIEANFNGIMMACSSDEHYCEQLVLAGCTHKASSKGNMPNELITLLTQEH